MIENVLATSRLVRLVREDDITEPLRDQVMMKYPKVPIHCISCLSVWAGFAIFGLSKFKCGKFVVSALALSEATIIGRQIVDGR